ncbi:IS5 family transposase [Paraburkholderia caledonica]|uniref:IS5 family transposase n=1 Tax=Paraburkholderia caledonica TaxID=134536 RepID=A0AB73IMR3_9BURK|nr:IS5 family transposase [Paraburkholderia caledonica]
MRDVERQGDQVADSNRAALQELIDRTKRILSQKAKDKNKLYALHAPEVECLAKGKVRTPYEFGVGSDNCFGRRIDSGFLLPG